MSLELFRKFMRDFFSQTLGNERPTSNKCTRFLRTLIIVRENSCSVEEGVGGAFFVMQNFTRHEVANACHHIISYSNTILVIKYHASY